MQMGKKKRRIKSRKNKLSEYINDNSNIPRYDPVERLMYCIGDKLSIKKIEKIIERKEQVLNNLTYSCFKITYYEYPMGSERPRSRRMGNIVTNYVPNAKENKKYLQSLIEDIKDEIQIIHTPIFLKCNAYHKMPTSVPIEEQVLFEAGILNPVTKPDFDNMIKVYTDMMIEQIILDDDLIYRSHIEKFFSFLPRVELSIYYENEFASKFIYNRIKNRESVKKLGDHIELAQVI